ncbi:hypothetical protein BC830DRAFT_723775 [Chytriomyces sp. MP71]|nr:hypothetical protein BC830DRAFT_723775 [Chytriomyces sp. MP71]
MHTHLALGLTLLVPSHLFCITNAAVIRKDATTTQINDVETSILATINGFDARTRHCFLAHLQIPSHGHLTAATVPIVCNAATQGLTALAAVRACANPIDAIRLDEVAPLCEGYIHAQMAMNAELRNKRRDEATGAVLLSFGTTTYNVTNLIGTLDNCTMADCVAPQLERMHQALPLLTTNVGAVCAGLNVTSLTACANQCKSPAAPYLSLFPVVCQAYPPPTPSTTITVAALVTTVTTITQTAAPDAPVLFTLGTTVYNISSLVQSLDNCTIVQCLTPQFATVHEALPLTVSKMGPICAGVNATVLTECVNACHSPAGQFLQFLPVLCNQYVQQAVVASTTTEYGPPQNFNPADGSVGPTATVSSSALDVVTWCVRGARLFLLAASCLLII